MANKPTTAYVAATICAAVGAAIGVWLPWVRKRPVGYTDGQPFYTSEYVSGLETGLRGIDPFVILLVVAVVGATVLARHRDWRPDLLLMGSGGLLLFVSGSLFRDYWSGERYAVEPGLYLLLASGFLLVLIGVSSILKQRVTLTVDDSHDPRIR